MHVKLSNDYVMQIDEEDSWVLNIGCTWYGCKDQRKVYVRAYELGSGRSAQKKLLLHRIIIQAPEGLTVDHKNGDGLDNRRDNLRICTDTQNKANCGVRSHNTSG
ncbi:hypothetical protein LCGC14_2744780, partial [marine sediment metagenome]